MANKGHYQNKSGSRQGIYVCSPNGELLTSINSLNPDHVLEVIQQGLNKWNNQIKVNYPIKLDRTVDPSHRWEDSYPNDGLVLTCYKIDLKSDPPTYDNRSDRWNIDHVWFNNDEMKMWIPNDLLKGSKSEVPAFISERLIRFHLVDNVRGQTLPFAREEIKSIKIQTEVLNTNGSFINLKIFGIASAVAKGEWLLGENDWTPTYLLNHSMKTEILGRASYNVDSDIFMDFELVAVGQRYGKTQNNGRKNSPDSNYIGFYFKKAERSAADKIAPAFVDMYNADWIIQPKNKTRL